MSKDPTIRELLEAILSKGPATIAEAVKLEAFREEVIQEVLKRLEPRLEGFENVLDSHEESITALFNPEIKGE